MEVNYKEQISVIYKEIIHNTHGIDSFRVFIHTSCMAGLFSSKKRVSLLNLLSGVFKNCDKVKMY